MIWWTHGGEEARVGVLAVMLPYRAKQTGMLCTVRVVKQHSGEWIGWELGHRRTRSEQHTQSASCRQR